MNSLWKGKEIKLSNGKTVYQKPSVVPLVILILVVFTVISMKVTKFDGTALVTRGDQFFVILVSRCCFLVSFMTIDCDNFFTFFTVTNVDKCFL